MDRPGEKAALFELWRSLGSDDEEEMDMREQLDRRRRAAFFTEGGRGRRAVPVRTDVGVEEKVIAGTQGGNGTEPLVAGPRSGGGDGMDETVIPDSARPAVKTMRRSDSSPLLPAKRLSSTSAQSPSLDAGMRKRRRGAVATAAKMKPAEEQIFRSLTFFYVPNNDIAPARRLRITRAREHGACWVRDAVTATHIVVDKHLDYADVQKVVSEDTLARRPRVVNEEYPIDCIQFRWLLDDEQEKYRVSGAPVAEEGYEEAGLPTEKSVTVEDEARTRRDRGRDVVDATLAPRDAQPTTLAFAEDELARCMSMMQEFQHLPLDHDDAESQISREEGTSDSGSDKAAKKTRIGQTKAGRKGGRFEDQFVCNQAGEQEAKTESPNSRTIQVLQSMADYYERIDDHWRCSSYRKAIGTLRRHHVKVRTAGEAINLPHIGWRIAQKIEEIVTTDSLRRLEYAQEEPVDEALQLFLQIYGVGSRLAQQWVAQGYRTLDDLAQRARLTPSQRIGLEHYDDLQKRIPRREVEALGAAVRATAAAMDPAVEFITGGSYRRGAESSGDVDLIITKKGTSKAAELRPFLDKLVDRLEAEGIVVARLSSPRRRHDDGGEKDGGGSIWHGCCALPGAKDDDQEGTATWRRLDLLLVPEAEMGGALLYFTGDDLFNRSMRLLAAKKGMRLNQHGLFRGRAAERELVEGRDERRIFEILGVRWREPRERWC
ncbi:hypothetical protein XA68_17519 [Ophiocordyceps unilateralis]|uniref:DNA polymerase lambda n=1 Tax=Ophiocordyceps unilateralis TaxID=268505 RepID=A0A2A9P4P7_OPHUN|nr:hypothetical protein XA68_17519 [Ophiocordyceps unilateralis]